MEQQPSIGRTVHYAPPQDCVGPASLTMYPAIITQINQDPVKEDGKPDWIETTVELTTFGPNSLYFQHKVKYSPELKPGCWTWPPRV
jgi:hypothetical protein